MPKTDQVNLKGFEGTPHPLSPLEGGRSVHDRGGEHHFSPSLDISSLSRHTHSCNRDFLTIQCLKCGHNRKVRAGSRDRTCPSCQKSIYEKTFENYKRILKGRSDLKFLTLTSKPVKTQNPEYVKFLGKSLTKLMHRKIFGNVKGLIAVVECKKSKMGLFYYHIHCIVSAPFIAQKRISEAWAECSGFPIVHIKKISRTRNRALRYVLKYVLKGFELEDPDDREDFKESMKGVRFIRSYGDFYNSEYRSAQHVYFPCPDCGSVGCWIVTEFVDTVDLVEGKPYGLEVPDG